MTAKAQSRTSNLKLKHIYHLRQQLKLLTEFKEISLIKTDNSKFS